MSDHEAGVDPSENDRLEAWLGLVDAALARLQVAPRVRRLMVVDLQRDLEESLNAGADVDSLLDPDVTGFALSLAQADGANHVIVSRRPPATLRDVILTALAGGLLGAAIAWFVVYPYGSQIIPNAPVVTALILLHGTAAAVTIAAAVLAVRSRFRDDPTVNQSLLVKVGAGLLAGGLASILPIAALAAATGYSTNVFVTVPEAGIASLCCAAAITIATRTRTRPTATAAAHHGTVS